MVISGEDFVKGWLLPASGSMLEPGKQVPEWIICRGNGRWTPSPGPKLRPGHIRPQPLADPATGAVGRRDERFGERKSPRGLLAFEAAPAASGTDEVPDLVQGDEVAHLAADGRDADLEPALRAAVAVPHADHDGAAAAVNAPDPVAGTEVVDVQVEGPRVHRERSVVGAVAVTRIPP